MAVRAVNAKKLEVTFSGKVDETEAEKGENYTFGGFSPTNPEYELQLDEKTVIITFDNAIPNGTTFVFTVEPIKTKAPSTEKTERFAKTITFSDTLKPAVKEVDYPAVGEAEIVFTEDMSTVGSVTVSAPKHDTTKAAVTWALDEDTLEFENLQKDVEYTVTITGAKDQAGNLITPNPTTVVLTNTMAADETKPTVVGLDATKVGELKITFSEKLQTQDSDGFVAKLKVGSSEYDVKVSGGYKNAAFDKTGTVLTLRNIAGSSFVYDAILTVGVKSITVSSYKDLAGNAGDPYTKVVEFIQDKTAPKFVSHEVKTISGVQYLIIKFDEIVTVNEDAAVTTALTGTFVDDKSITYPLTAVAKSAASVYDYDNVGYSDSIKISLFGLTVNRVYNVTVTAALAVDTASPDKNASAAIPVSFTLGLVADTDKPEVSTVTVQGSEDTVVVVFDKSVTAATALNLSNYLVEGEAVFEKAIFDGADTNVKLTLKANIINPTGVREFVIKNVADASGNVMKTHTRQVEFKENVKPVLESAKITGANSIVATFSKSVSGTAVFEVYVDGVKATTGFSTGALSGKTVTITSADALTLSKSYEVKYISGLTDTSTPVNTVVAGTLVAVTN